MIRAADLDGTPEPRVESAESNDEELEQSLNRPNALWSKGELRIRSSASSDCRRALHYSLTGVEPSNPITEESRFIMDTGNALEGAILAAVEREGLFRIINRQATVRIELDDGLVVTGHVDALIEDMNGVEYVGEVKSRGGEAYRNWEVLGANRSHPDAVQQMALYVYGLYGEARDAYIFVMNVADRTWSKERIPAYQIATAYNNAVERLTELTRWFVTR